MKTKLFKRITSVLLIMALIVGAGTSCKKDDPAPKQNEPFSGFTTNIPYATFSGDLEMQTDWEKDNDIQFHSHILGKYISGLDGANAPQFGSFLDAIDPFSIWSMAHDVSSAVHDIKKKIDTLQVNIKKVEAKIQKIENELEALKADIANLERVILNEINIEKDELELYADFSAIEDDYIVINEMLNGKLPLSSIWYYRDMIDSIINRSNLIPLEIKIKLTENNNKLKNDFSKQENQSKIVEKISSIATHLGVTDVSSSVFTTALNLFIRKNPNATPAQALLFYTYMEKKLLKAVHYQLHGLIVAGNMINASASGNQSNFLNWKKEEFNVFIGHEVQLLKDLAYALAINSTSISYRDFTDDMQYIAAGIAEDKLQIGLLARAHFTASILQADGDSMSQLISGVIYTPNNYYKNGLPTPDNSTLKSRIVINSTNEIDYSLTFSTANPIIQSSIPYTSWTSNKGVLSAWPDNQWRFYQGGIQTTMIISNAQTIENCLMFDKTASNEPWVHNLGSTELSFNSSVVIKWYNPDDPDYLSATPDYSPTTGHTMPFGFYAYKWLWGYQALNQGVLGDNLKYSAANDSLIVNSIKGISTLEIVSNPGASGLENLDDFEYYPNESEKQEFNYLGMVIDSESDFKITAGHTPCLFQQVQSWFNLQENGSATPAQAPVTMYTYAGLQRYGSVDQPISAQITSYDSYISLIGTDTIVSLMNNVTNSGTNTNKSDTVHVDYSYNNNYLFRSSLVHYEIVQGGQHTPGYDLPLSVQGVSLAQPIFKTTFNIAN